MNKNIIYCRIRIFLILILISSQIYPQQVSPVNSEILSTILKATKFMDEKVSLNDGYVWYYETDLSRRWGEMEASPTMSWIQGAGIVAMGNLFLDIYNSTKDEYYYRLAEKTVSSLIKGQLNCGGWNYMIDFAGEESLKKWYGTIGKSGWRLEEFREYLGNATFDDDATEGAASLLLKIYLTKNDLKYKPALDKAINFILKSQYKNGGWPQRFPKAKIDYKKSPVAYSNDITFNDGVTWNNIKFLLQCYYTLNDKKYIEPIKRGMNIYLLTQQPNPQAGWSQQYTLDFKPDAARTYEMRCLDPQYTIQHLEILMKFYEMTGDAKYLKRIQDGIDWVRSVRLDSGEHENAIKVPKFVEITTNKAMYLHRKGENTKYGSYYFDYSPDNIVAHYNSIRTVNLKTVVDLYSAIKNQKIPNSVGTKFLIQSIKNGMSKIDLYEEVDKYCSLNEEIMFANFKMTQELVKRIITNLDEQGRWLTNQVFISYPYKGESTSGDANTSKYVSTRVGNEYDTSPFENETDKKYISTGLYIRNIKALLKYLEQLNSKE